MCIKDDAIHSVRVVGRTKQNETKHKQSRINNNEQQKIVQIDLPFKKYPFLV